MLKHAHLRQLLKYNPATGRFTWLVDGRNQHQRRGKQAGCLDPLRRVKIRIEGEQFLASRLAVFWMTGHWPRNLVDHHNRDMSDNSWKNLRLATSSENLHNMQRKENASGLKGAVFDKQTGRYRARLRVNYHVINLGRFDTAKEAHAAYVTAAKRYFGEFARAE